MRERLACALCPKLGCEHGYSSCAVFLPPASSHTHHPRLARHAPEVGAVPGVVGQHAQDGKARAPLLAACNPAAMWLDRMRETHPK